MASDRAQILITAIDQTKAALASAKANLEGLSSAASKVNGVLAGLGAALSLGALVAAGKAALDTADNLSKLLNAVPESLWWLFGAGYLGYTGARSFDKWRGVSR